MPVSRAAITRTEHNINKPTPQNLSHPSNDMEAQRRYRLDPNSIFNKQTSNEMLEIDILSPTTSVPPCSDLNETAGTFSRGRRVDSKRSVQDDGAHKFPSSSKTSKTSQDSTVFGRRPSRRVRFHPDVKGRTFEVDKSDRHRMFYSPEDMRALQEQTREDVKLLRRLKKKERRAKAASNGNDDHDNAPPLTPDEQLALHGIALRGIEQFVSKRTWSDRSDQQRGVIYAVLDEQEYLREVGRNTDDIAMQRIASVSSNLSLEARRRASALGRQDAEDTRR